jgi:hypothetical protein
MTERTNKPWFQQHLSFLWQRRGKDAGKIEENLIKRAASVSGGRRATNNENNTTNHGGETVGKNDRNLKTVDEKGGKY